MAHRVIVQRTTTRAWHTRCRTTWYCCRCYCLLVCAPHNKNFCKANHNLTNSSNIALNPVGSATILTPAVSATVKVSLFSSAVLLPYRLLHVQICKSNILVLLLHRVPGALLQQLLPCCMLNCGSPTNAAVAVAAAQHCSVFCSCSCCTAA
eukprot:GHRR01006850.1.p1 GENE.GHRR01006850.1~~GHRR01006850.1.p1  ORF type:complete len:151 (-),score=38.34 GHRR01006850.1:499-951(-)